MAVDEAAELLGHGVYQLLLVPLVLPKLGENVVLPARVSHPAQSRNSRVTARAALRQAPRRNAGEVPPLGPTEEVTAPTGSSPRFCVKMGTPSWGKLYTVCISALNPASPSPCHRRVPAPKANRCDNAESLTPLVLPFHLVTWQMTVLEYQEGQEMN